MSLIKIHLDEGSRPAGNARVVFFIDNATRTITTHLTTLRPQNFICIFQRPKFPFSERWYKLMISFILEFSQTVRPPVKFNFLPALPRHIQTTASCHFFLKNQQVAQFWAHLNESFFIGLLFTNSTTRLLDSKRSDRMLGRKSRKIDWLMKYSFNELTNEQVVGNWLSAFIGRDTNDRRFAKNSANFPIGCETVN